MRLSKWLVVAAGLSLAGGSAVAIAAYNTPSKAKTIKTDMVVAYHVCSGTPNATMFFGTTPLPGCTPPSPMTADHAAHLVTFGPKGSMNLAVALGSGDIKVAVKGSDIMDNGSPASINLKAAASSVISTVNSCANMAGATSPPAPGTGVDCTGQDLSFLFSAVIGIPCVAGKCSLKSSINTIIGAGAITTGSLANTQISGISVKDPDGDIAFTSGLFIP
jgi:hypothetical protein